MKITITSKYGEMESFRTHPHNGIDLNYPANTDVNSVHSGVVDKVTNYVDNIGKGVIIKNDNGETSIYGHLNDIVVKEGQRVGEGTMIGHSGSTGTSTGNHLHYGEKLDGSFIDPTQHYEQLASVGGNSGSGGFMEGVNSFSDWVINKEVEMIFKPIGIGIKNMCIDLFWFIQANIPEIMGSVTLLVAALIMLGIKPHKIASIYGVSMIVSAFWRMTT